MYEISYENFLFHSKTCLPYDNLPDTLIKDYVIFFAPESVNEPLFFRFRACKYSNGEEICIGSDEFNPELRWNAQLYGKEIFVKIII